MSTNFLYPSAPTEPLTIVEAKLEKEIFDRN